MSKGKILSKFPCFSDLFEGRAHEKLSCVIADEIRNDANCTIIGIDGGWGSGKSNLVGMIEKRLTDKRGSDGKKEQYHFFTYDAWGHQNDLPRRSILEELTTDITNGDNALLNEDIWKEKLKNLLAKKRNTHTKTVPSLNYAIVTIALMTALTPAVNTISDNIECPLYKLLFTLLFFLSGGAFIAYKQIKSLKKHEQKITCENFFSELFLLYKKEIKENVKYETISEREPSTKQFKDWMQDINKSLRPIDKYLIIVFDNMDRLPKQKVQELWSAIHSFFSETRYSNIKVIVPFDRLHIRNAFQSENLKDSRDKNIKVYGDDFINKTFYIVYHVAPPILSGWKQYFEYQWKAAFGEDYPLDSAVLQIYDMMTDEQSPRKIVAFINELVTIRSVCDESIPDRYIALFIFGRSEISLNPMQEILTPSYLGSLEFMYKEDKEMASYMSSLFYQLPLKDAVDVVYFRHFTKELDDNNPVSIGQMKELGIQKLFAILDRAIAEVSNTANATLALHIVFGNESSVQIQNLWECLYIKDKEKRGAVTKYVPYHKVLLTHIQHKSEYIKELIRCYHEGFNENSDVRGYLKGIDDLAEVEEINIYGMLENIQKTITPNQFITLVEETDDEYKYYGLYCDNASLSDYLSEQDVNEWGTLTILPRLNRQEYPLLSFKSKIEEGLKASNLSVESAKIMFSKLKELRTDNTINYYDYFQNNKLESLFQNARNDEFKYDLIAMRLSAFNNYSSQYNYIYQYLNKNSDEDIIKVANISNNYVSYGNMLLSLENFHIPFVKSLCKYHTIHAIGTQSMNILSVAKKFSMIVANSDITSGELFIRMNDWKKYKENIKESDIPLIPISFFEAANKTNCELSTYVLELAGKYLQTVSQDEWIDILKTEDNMQFNLLKLYHPVKIQPFFDAFKAVMKSYANGESDKRLKKDTVESVIIISEDMHHGVSKLFLDIRDIFLSSGITGEKLKYFGKWLFKYANMAHKAGCLEKILPSELLDDNEIIQMLEQNKEVVKGMKEHSDDPSEFTEKLDSMLQGKNKDNEDLSKLCNFLGIGKPKAKKK